MCCGMSWEKYEEYLAEIDAKKAKAEAEKQVPPCCCSGETCCTNEEAESEKKLK